MGDNWIIPIAIGAVLLVLIGAAVFWMMGAPSRPMTSVSTHAVATATSTPVASKPPPMVSAAARAYLLPNTQPSVITVPTENGTLVYVDVRKLDQMPGLTHQQKDWLAQHVVEWDNEPAIDVGTAVIEAPPEGTPSPPEDSTNP